MADSSNSSDRQVVYFCHSCDSRVSGVTEEIHCINCDSGFVEEVVTEQPPEQNDDIFSIFSTGSGDQASDNFLNILASTGIFTQNGGNTNFTRFFTTVINSAHANGGGQFIRLLHGNPDDYVWSSDSLDSVITQLLNQIDNAGPPPMSGEDICNLNEITISLDHIKNKMQCPICMEDFLIDEKVKELVCHHFFHADCIIKWLKLHSTCPTCRMNFSTEKSQNASSSSNASSTTTTSTSRQENETTLNTSSANQSASYNFNDDDLD